MSEDNPAAHGNPNVCTSCTEMDLESKGSPTVQEEQLELAEQAP